MILFILLLSFVLRLITADQSLWLDEANSVISAQSMDFVSFITKYPTGDYHPPGYFGILWIWIHMFGDLEISVRMPSIIFGVLTVYLTYLLGKNLFSKKIGVIAALLLSVSPLHVYYSQEARMYSFAALSVTLSFYFFFRLLTNHKSLLNRTGYIVSLLLVFYSDYVAILVIPLQFIFIVWFYRPLFLTFLSTWAISFICALPWLIVFPQQFLEGRNAAKSIPGWANVVGGTSLKDILLVPIKFTIGRISFENKIIYITIAGLAILVDGFLLFKALFIRDKKILLLFSWFLLPMISAYLISYIIPIFSYFRFIFLIPPFCLLIAYGIFQLKKQIQPVSLLIVLLISMGTLIIYYTSPKYQREDWINLVKYIKANNEKSVVIFRNTDTLKPFYYYSRNDLVLRAGLKKAPTKSIEDTIDIKSLESYERIFVVDYLVDVYDPDRWLTKSLENSRYQLTKTTDFNGVGFLYEYQKK